MASTGAVRPRATVLTTVSCSVHRNTSRRFAAGFSWMDSTRKTSRWPTCLPLMKKMNVSVSSQHRWVRVNWLSAGAHTTGRPARRPKAPARDWAIACDAIGKCAHRLPYAGGCAEQRRSPVPRWSWRAPQAPAPWLPDRTGRRSGLWRQLTRAGWRSGGSLARRPAGSCSASSRSALISHSRLSPFTRDGGATGRSTDSPSGPGTRR